MSLEYHVLSLYIWFLTNPLMIPSKYSLTILHSYQLALAHETLQRMQRIPNRPSCFFCCAPSLPTGFFLAKEIKILQCITEFLLFLPF